MSFSRLDKLSILSSSSAWGKYMGQPTWKYVNKLWSALANYIAQNGSVLLTKTKTYRVKHPLLPMSLPVDFHIFVAIETEVPNRQAKRS